MSRRPTLQAVPPEPDDTRTQALNDFVTATGSADFTRLIQRGRERDATYHMELTDGRTIKLGTIDTIWSQAELARTLAVTTGRVIRTIKPPKWRDLIAVLIMAATDIDDDPADNQLETTREWLRLYLARATPITRDQAATNRLPFTETDALHIHPEHFARFIRTEIGENIRLKDIRSQLHDAGYRARKITFNRDGNRDQRTSAIYFAGPGPDDTPECSE
jgi:hypothetical protein